jgi:hypothetical protein
MQELGLFVTLAEIAGVFVGFGALIAVRSGGASDAREVAYIGSVVVSAVWVIVMALAPVTLGAYDIGERELWFVSGLVALAGFVLAVVSLQVLPQFREAMESMSRERRMREIVANNLLLVPAVIALILVVLGLFPDQDAALYLTAVVLGLFLTALTLLWLVFEHRPTPVPDEGEGSNA